MDLVEIADKIIYDLKKEKGINPVVIFKNIATNNYIRIHGPEHHILDGASLLVAYKNAGGNINLDEALLKIKEQGLKMPGAMCGLWGVCGAVTSVGAALSIIDGTGPLSNDGSWGNHMGYASKTIAKLGEINGPRCCKRDGKIALKYGAEYINSHYKVNLEYNETRCDYSKVNIQCIKEKCPFYE